MRYLSLKKLRKQYIMRYTIKCYKFDVPWLLDGVASIDWKDAYYSVPIDKDQRKFLAFNWKDKTYQYTCLPNGLSCAPRFFTKLTKVMFAGLRNKGFISTSYIDDCLVFDDSFKACEANVEETAEMSVNAGLVVHPEKSVVIPMHKIVFLGFGWALKI